jgi:ATP-dependent Clp protease ATP-binding subunit ClpC
MKINTVYFQICLDITKIMSIFAVNLKNYSHMGLRDNLEQNLDRVLSSTRMLAESTNDSFMRISHFMYATIAGNNIISQIVIDQLNEAGTIDTMMTELKNNYEAESDHKAVSDSPKKIINFSKVLEETIANLIAKLEAGQLLMVETLFVKLYESNDPSIEILKKYGITNTMLLESIGDSRMASNVNMRDEEESDLGFKPKGKKSSKTPFLDDFGRDLTEMAAQGKLDPVYNREDESERVAQVLARRKKNNPVLIGDPGIGKTAIVEKLAISIQTKNCPPPLFNKRVISLDLAALVAGTKYRGQFEERIKKLIEEVRNNPNIILFIDEIHMLVGAGNAAGSMDAANIFKPALARGELQCIGATTLNEYRESIEKDGALERRFQKLVIDEPSAADTLEIIKTLLPKYEEFHKVTYTDAAVVEIVRLSDRYISNRFFPDKAIDVMDEAGARCQVGLVAPPIIAELERELSAVLLEKQETVLTDKYEKAGELLDKERKLNTRIEEETKKWQKSVSTERSVITPDMIAKTVSIMTKIPVDKLSQSERKQLLEVGDKLKEFVVGQDDAVNLISSSIKRNRLGLSKSTKPIGVFLFIGNTGVGKTYLAKMLAKHVFGSENNLIRFDMSEYSQPFNISRLIGSAPGYVGYEKGGQLTEKVRNNPYSVVLFDEIEKAHPDVYNILLQLFDEGRLTDEQGRTVNFKNTIIIMTSNVGSKELQMFGKGIGYSTGTMDNDKSRSIIEKAMKNKFKPEFLNRIDEIVQFNMLDKDDIRSIVDLQIAEMVRRAQENNYFVRIKEGVAEFIYDKGYSDEYGAREVGRSVQRWIENPISDELLKLDIIENVIIEVTVENEEIKINVQQPY